MADDGLVINVSDLVTQVTCDGCGQPLSLLDNHLGITAGVKRSTIEQVDLRFVNATRDDSGAIIALADLPPDEAANPIRYYLGSNPGANAMLNFHDYDCLCTWATAQGSGPLTLAPHEVDAHAEGRGSE